MAKRKVIVEQTIPDEQVSPAQETDFEGAPDDVLGRLRQQHETDTIRVKVYKIVPGSAQPMFCFSQDEDIDEEGLQNCGYGGGRYQIAYTIEGKQVYSRFLAIADKPVPQKDLTIADVQVQMLREQSQMNRDLLMAVLGRQNGGSPLSEVAQMWNMMKGTPGGNSGIEGLIQIFKQGLELGGKTAGDTVDWKTALISSVKEIALPVAQTVMSMKAGAGQPPMVPPNGNGMFGGEAVVPQPNASVNAEEQLKQMLKQSLAWLKPKILQGMSVGLALEWITANAEDPAWTPLINFVTAKTPEQMAEIDSDLANEPYKSWVLQMQQGLREHFKDQLAQDQEDEE